MRVKFGFETLPWFSIQLQHGSRRWIVAGRIGTGAVSLYAARHRRPQLGDGDAFGPEQRLSFFLMTWNMRFRASAPMRSPVPEAAQLSSCPAA
jgi:hypothetical protein